MSLLSIKSNEKVRTRSQGLKEKSSPKDDPLATEELFLTDERNVLTKCGEIFVSKTTNFTLVCSACKSEFSTMESFGIHWQEENNCVEDNSDDLRLTPKIEIEEETLCIPASFDEVKSEVIEEPEIIQPAAADNIDDYEDDVLNECLSPLDMEVDDKDDISEKEKVKSPIKRKCKPRKINAIDDDCKSADQDDDSWHEDDEIKRTVKKRGKYKPRIPKPAIDLSCNFCNRRFSDRRSFRQHTHKVPDDFKCKYCDKILADSSEYLDHVKMIHQGIFKYQCSHCLKSFRTRRIRQAHIGIHTGVRPYKCTICPKSYFSKHSLDEHTKRLHINQSQADYACELCDKRYTLMQTLIAHRRTHTGEKPFQCEECGKSFSASGHLSYHRKRHAEKNFKCDSCEMAFTHAPELKEHKIKHTGERPFKCEVCEKTFPRRGALRLHMDLHSTVNKYVCDLCGKSFKQNIGLYTHRKSH